MAAPKSKRSIRKKQSTKQSAKPHRNQQSQITNQKSTHFPEATGKVLEDVEFATSTDHNVISLSFRDNTCLDFVIDTCFTVQGEYLDRGHGDRRVLKNWPPIHSQWWR